MGLRLQVGKKTVWAGTYTTFHLIREAVALHFGLIGYSNLPQKKDWLYYFLSHSDSEGSMTPSVCGRVAAGLEKIHICGSDDLEESFESLVSAFETSARMKKRLLFF